MGNFMAATRQNWLRMPDKTIELGAMTQMDLYKVGLLSELMIRVKGTLTCTAGSGTITLKDLMDGKPYGLIKELRLRLNSGLTPIKIPGYMLYLYNLVTGYGNAFPDVAGGTLNGGLTNAVYRFGTNAGANPVDFTLRVPVSINKKDPVGLLLLQSPDTVVTFEIEWAPVSDMFTLTGDAAVTFTGTLITQMETFSIPLNKEDRPDLGTIHSLVYQPFEIPTTGENFYDFERGNIYMRVIDRISLNGAKAGITDVEQLTIQYNGNQYPYQRLDAGMQLAIQRERYGRDLPQGVYVWDWSGCYLGVPSSSRDWIHSGVLTEFKQGITIASGATLGQNNNKLETLREILIPVATR